MKIKCNIFVYILGIEVWEFLVSSRGDLLVMDVLFKWCFVKFLFCVGREVIGE